MLSAAHVLAMDAKNLLDVVDSVRMRYPELFEPPEAIITTDGRNSSSVYEENLNMERLRTKSLIASEYSSIVTEEQCSAHIFDEAKHDAYGNESAKQIIEDVKEINHDENVSKALDEEMRPYPRPEEKTSL